jgi:hypothetical protein
MAVYNWIAANWPLLLAILTGPFGLAIYEITTHWNTFVGFFTGLPGQLESAAGTLFDWIPKIFKAAINDVIRAWDSLKFTTPSVDVFGFHTPSVTIGVPNIPTLAQGGLITSSGLVYAHAGEAISPAPAGHSGPIVNVGEQHFHNELDVDAFMRRAAWLARTQRRGLPTS